MDTLYFVALEQNGRKIRKRGKDERRRIFDEFFAIVEKVFFFRTKRNKSLIVQFEDIIFEGNRRVGQVLYF